MIILLIFSIPPDMPSTMMIKVITSPTVCQKLLPKDRAMELKARAKPSTLPGASVVPVREPAL